MRPGQYEIIENELDSKRVIWTICVQKHGERYPHVWLKTRRRTDLEGKRRLTKAVELIAERQRRAWEVQQRLERSSSSSGQQAGPDYGASFEVPAGMFLMDSFNVLK